MFAYRTSLYLLRRSCFHIKCKVLQELPAQLDGIMEIARGESSPATLLCNCLLNIPFLDPSASLQGPKSRCGKGVSYVLWEYCIYFRTCKCGETEFLLGNYWLLSSPFSLQFRRQTSNRFCLCRAKLGGAWAVWDWPSVKWLRGGGGGWKWYLPSALREMVF